MELSRRAPTGVTIPTMDNSGIPTQNMDSILHRNPTMSIYQTSVNLMDKLACIEGFGVYLSSLLEDTSQQDEDGANSGGAPYLNPIQLLWDTFRQGTSLCVIYNALQPDQPLSTTLDESQNVLKQRKDRVYRFVKACKENHIVRDEELFTISELFRDDTNAFVKVLKTIEIVVDTIESRGLLDMSRLVERPSARFAEAQLGPPQDNRERIIKEFIETERKYVQDLELVQGYMDELQRKNIISHESFRCIFANLNTIADFQRRFLIDVEGNANRPPEDQHFGSVFINMSEGFMVYEPYCANFTRASEQVMKDVEALKTLANVIEPHYELPSMLIKPVQRICKYPILLDELSKCYDPSSPIYNELKEGKDAIQITVRAVNEAQRKESNLKLVSELEERVEDWKGYAIDTFGELFLHGKFVMSTGDVKRELSIYLFENILICCKDVSEKDRRRNQKHKTNGLQLKGRIFLFSIHSVVDTSRDSNFSLTIYWKDVMTENFTLMCNNEEQLKTWKTTMEKLINRARQSAPNSEVIGGIRQQQQSTSLSAKAHRSASGKFRHVNNPSYDSEDENTPVMRRGRYSEGSALTASMMNDNLNNDSPTTLTYRKTYDGSGGRGRGAKKLVGNAGQGDYQSELVEGIERSATISTFHRRQATNGSMSSFGEGGGAESPLGTGGYRGPNTSTSPMPGSGGSGGSYYDKHEAPPVPVPPLIRGSATSESPGGIPSNSGIGGSYSMPTTSLRGPGAIHINNPPVSHANMMSTISPMTPAGLPSHEGGVLTGGGISALSMTPTPVSSAQSGKPVKVKVHFNEDIFVIIVKHDILFRDLVERVERKIKICAGPHVGVGSSAGGGGQDQQLATSPSLGIRMKYQDEDGDMVIIGSDEDVQLALESANAAKKDEGSMSTLNLFASI